MQKDSNEKEIRMLRDKAKESLNEISKLQTVWANKIRSTEDDGKAQLSLERKRLEDLLAQVKRSSDIFEHDCKDKSDQLSRLQRSLEQAQEEKSRLEERVRRENQLL